MPRLWSYTLAVTSTIFRITVYIFLRVIPAPVARDVLLVSFPSYLAAYALSPAPKKAQEETKPPSAGSSAMEKTHDSGVETERTPTPDASPSPLMAFLLSLPIPSRAINLANLAVNTILFLFAMDLALTSSVDDARDVVFTRVGAVYPDGAKIVVRYPLSPQAAPSRVEDEDLYGFEAPSQPTSGDGWHVVHVVWRQARSGNNTPLNQDMLRRTRALNLTREHDWVGTVTLDGMYPDTEYEYMLTSSDQTPLKYPAVSAASSFISSLSFLPTELASGRSLHFRTFPDPLLRHDGRGAHFKFIATSCVTPNFPYVPLHGRRIRGFDLLAEYIWPPASSASTPVLSPVASSGPAQNSSSQLNDSAVKSTALLPLVSGPATAFMLFLGDFIYADVPVYMGDNREAYRRLYRRNYLSNSFRRVYERLPIFHTYDDHEIINNYIGGAADPAPFSNADDAFRLYNADGNYNLPATSRSSTFSVSSAKAYAGDEHYYSFRHGDAAFFVLDTRRYRSSLETEPALRTMLGARQLREVVNWLKEVNNTATFKFLVSSVPFTSLWTHDAQTDSWAGYAYEKSALLRILHTVPNVVILSGDRHEFAAIEFPAGEPTHVQPLHTESEQSDDSSDDSSDEEEHAYEKDDLRSDWDAGRGRYDVLEISTSPLSMFYIPLVRTLNLQSEEAVRRTKVFNKTLENGEIVTEHVVEEVPRERALKYIGEGNYKWSSIEVDTRDSDHPVAHIEIMIDGAKAWTHTIHGHPVKSQPANALGTFVPQSFKGVLDMIGLKPSRWF
ncbi:hypothetical protein WOLCODRAFT_110896 [Wolfiporia cocos MD-104 SS10]|uniref:PhoD-like phosphatase metallophosphatase domain-containing protein n=1 Tax=Wolfiporia cocos (strain MD-104) TaxID=742152 RepID=A0A2H3JBK0_WOLCO|nr:hypothetical protein WOLCODRAFT_110896 [Wolfiporia cocos MD-104 SS10]